MARLTLNNGDLTAYALSQGYKQTSEIGNAVRKGAVVLNRGGYRHYEVRVEGFPATRRTFDGLYDARQYFKRLQKVWGQGARIPDTRYYTFTHWLLNAYDANSQVMDFVKDVKSDSLFVVLFNNRSKRYRLINVYSTYYTEVISDHKAFIANFGYYKDNPQRRDHILIKGKIDVFLKNVLKELVTYGFMKETEYKDINVSNIQVLWD